MNWINKLDKWFYRKYDNFIYRFKWMKVYNSPFKFIWPKFYIGKVAIGTPYFLPRKWVKCEDKPGYSRPVPKKIGFDFVPLGWKTKWTRDDYRHEWNPVWSFVFFGLQIALIFRPGYDVHYWECYLNYHFETDINKSIRERLHQAIDKFPCIWVKGFDDNEEKICYWNYILKKKYL